MVAERVGRSQLSRTDEDATPIGLLWARIQDGTRNNPCCTKPFATRIMLLQLQIITGCYTLVVSGTKNRWVFNSIGGWVGVRSHGCGNGPYEWKFTRHGVEYGVVE